MRARQLQMEHRACLKVGDKTILGWIGDFQNQPQLILRLEQEILVTLGGQQPCRTRKAIKLSGQSFCIGFIEARSPGIEG